DGHKQLAKYCSSSRDGIFSLRHAVFHLVKSGRRAEAFELLNDFAWVQSAIFVGDDEAQRRATIENLIRDCVELGIYFAPESDTPRFLSKAVHALSYDPNELASQVLARLGHDSKESLGDIIVSGSYDGTVRIWDATSGEEQHVLKGHSGPVTSVAI
ncbi:WD repeat-containing protein pop1, partial [Hondaea fermentalgiana]